MTSLQHMESSVTELTDRVQAALSAHKPLQILGGGSKAFYGVPRTGEALSTACLSGVISYEPSELVVTAGAGTPLSELEALLAQQGQCLPFEPPHFQWSAPAVATVGGMVATGLAGPARASVGGVRDYVLGLKLINGRAEHLTFGGQVMKNVAGYDVSRLMVGAMGTLGLITEVSLKVLPIAPAEATLCFEVSQSVALEHLHRWGARPLPLNASCWVHDPLSGGGSDLLFVRLRGAVAAVESACAVLLSELPGLQMDTGRAAADWEHCRNQTLPFFQVPRGDAVLWRLSVPQTAPELSLPWPQLVEWHGALRWLWAPRDAAQQLDAVARHVGGYATIFVANGAYSTGASGQFYPELGAKYTIERRLKDSFDPAAIFNVNRTAAAP